MNQILSIYKSNTNFINSYDASRLIYDVIEKYRLKWVRFTFNGAHFLFDYYATIFWYVRYFDKARSYDLLL